MDADTRRLVLLLAGAALGYGLLLAFNPARASLRDGGRCLLRYRQIWVLPLIFGLCHSGFSLWMRWSEARLIPGSPPVFLPWAGWQPPPWSEVWPLTWLPAAEGAAAVFNCLITAFPVSALLAVLFMCNWRGYQGVVWRGLQRRFGRRGGLAIHLGLLLGALAAAFKPVLFGGLTSLNAYFSEDVLLPAGEIINWLSFLFEYLLGVGVQIYVVLLCFAWIRGLNFDFDSLRRFALRRFVFVVRWAAVVLLISSLGIHLPLIVASFQSVGRREPLPWLEPTVQGARWTLAVLLLVFCSMQALLIFHNETLRAGLHDHFRLWRRHGLHIVWLLLIAFLHFFLLAAANAFLPRALGAWTWPAAAWSLLAYPTLWACLGSWLLASWVCLFKRCESNRPDADELVRF